MASQFQLIMRTGPTPGATFTLEGDQLNIGRDSTNEVTINDAEVSRHHARLTFQGGKYVLEDLGSTNGTFVNGQRSRRNNGFTACCGGAFSFTSGIPTSTSAC